MSDFVCVSFESAIVTAVFHLVVALFGLQALFPEFRGPGIEGKDQESIQLSTIPGPEHYMGK